MSDTPRTDKAVTLTFAAGHNTVCPNFARQLERELAEARAELKRKDEALRELFDSTASVRFDIKSRLGWRLACETSEFKRQHAAMAVAEPLVQQIRAAIAQGGKGST